MRACVCDQSCMLEFPSFHSTLLLLPFSSVGAVATLFPIFLRFLLIRVGALVGLSERERERKSSYCGRVQHLVGWVGEQHHHQGGGGLCSHRPAVFTTRMGVLARWSQAEREKEILCLFCACVRVFVCVCVLGPRRGELHWCMAAEVHQCTTTERERERESERERERESERVRPRQSLLLPQQHEQQQQQQQQRVRQLSYH